MDAPQWPSQPGRWEALSGGYTGSGLDAVRSARRSAWSLSGCTPANSEALALIESGEVVDALVSDLSMPGWNGVVTIQKARALRPGLPCFLLTGYVGERAALSARDAFTLVRKPISGQALVARLEAGLEAARL